ncbi:hypothetical protein Cfla_0313 [Cellulomonas flavigena DSM 20109]|uniref:Uncharacterized protein n=1 Tax=Cellulomonas flavigena (strain ATCC 482 / DSM 20109 / BCRC 11376 / JCM 18109 / NBRC 3775 / NCIMB 8073 / NRS 134) TaxID=446466 RepID=D5UH28_CELFN|nr:hypothetical protein Cfla_0313 [Cellulomonas flavigena DSM 20109]
MRAVAVYLVSTALLALVAVPCVIWLVVMADEIAQENSKAAGLPSGQLGWDFALMVGAPPVLGVAVATGVAAAVARRAHAGDWRVLLGAVVVVAAVVVRVVVAALAGSTATPTAAGWATAAVVAGALTVALAARNRRRSGATETPVAAASDEVAADAASPRPSTSSTTPGPDS